jgi:hypothetical protein
VTWPFSGRRSWATPGLGPRPVAMVFMGSEFPLTVHRGMPWMGGTVWAVEFDRPIGSLVGTPWVLCNLGSTWMGNPVRDVETLEVVSECEK